MKMRLDKYVAKSKLITRSQAKKLIKSGLVSVDEVIEKSANCILTDHQMVKLSNQVLSFEVNQYILLNKPKGFICATQDEVHPSALNCLNITNKTDLHFAGRLDQDTTGLVLISNDGQWTHRITSPKHKQIKTYLVSLSTSLSKQALDALEIGVLLNDSEQLTLPAKVELINELSITLGISEGRYHQVKRMIAAVGSHVTDLHRLSIGRVTICDTLKIGEWRYLTEEEIMLF
jgi:16S rRNA pseudouridine516 synthase